MVYCLLAGKNRIMDRNLRIAIDCRISNAQQGIGTAVLALAKALSDSTVTGQEYTFIVREDLTTWLAPYIYGPCSLVGIPAPKARPVSMFSKVKATLGRIAPLQFIWHKLHNRGKHVPVSDGYVESQKFDVVHFPTQTAYLTDLPSIYQPWDLQHLHFPQFFSKDEFESRERQYPAFCHNASFVCVQAEWTRQDVIHQYGLPADKVVVIPWGSVFDAYKTPSREAAGVTIEKYGLPGHFFFYPAVAWPHKNHEVIIHALHILKTEHGAAPHVYFTGRPTGYQVVLDKLAQDLGVFEQVHCLGFLSPEELQTIFNAATAMIFASKFEGFGLPILEAFHARTPVLCSNATTLPEVARDAALYFDPDAPAELASLMKLTLETPEVREELIRKGTVVLSQHSIENTAANFQALYEKTAVLLSQKQRLSQTSGRNLREKAEWANGR
jgi:glycosyltransferase involved in cell wall biosynthesis